MLTKSCCSLKNLRFESSIAPAGIKVIGGVSEDEEDDQDFGIFIKKILNRGLAATDGRLCVYHFMQLYL